jgi:hypothetical protein
MIADHGDVGLVGAEPGRDGGQHRGLVGVGHLADVGGVARVVDDDALVEAVGGSSILPVDHGSLDEYTKMMLLLETA